MISSGLIVGADTRVSTLFIYLFIYYLLFICLFIIYLFIISFSLIFIYFVRILILFFLNLKRFFLKKDFREREGKKRKEKKQTLEVSEAALSHEKDQRKFLLITKKQIKKPVDVDAAAILSLFQKQIKQIRLFLSLPFSFFSLFLSFFFSLPQFFCDFRFCRYG